MSNARLRDTPAPRRTLAIDVLPPESEVLRLLGYREGVTQLGDPMLAVLREARRTAPRFLHAAAEWIEVARDDVFRGRALFRGAECVALGAVSIGAALEEEAEALVARRQWTLALVLDAYGSAAVEEAVVTANAHICSDAEKRGLVAGRRIAPGYPQWPLEGQQELFTILGGRPAGIELNDASIMSPRKSVSFGIPLGRNLDAADPDLGCRSCSMAHCEYRRRPKDAA